MIERSRRVVLLIDYDNLQICASRDTPGRDLQLPPVVQLAQHYGTVIMARAYAEWNLSTERLAVYKAGIEPAFAPVLRTESDRSGKSLADTVMVAEGMDMLWTLSPDVVVLATSDKDLIPLVRVAKQRGAFVVVLGSDFTAIPLREMADEHVTYKQLITDAQGRYVTEAGPARQPAALPEPARRRPTRERNGRERSPVTAPAAAPTVAATPPPARIEREPQPAAAPVQAPAASTSAVEPVAPLNVGGTGDGDAQGLGRRRRRRGSRRRSERIGGVGEGFPNSDGGADAEDPYAEGSEGDAPEELNAPVEATSVQANEVANMPDTTVEVPSPEASTPEAEVVVPAPPAPRNRRRTARRPTVATADAGTAPTPAEEAVAATPLAQTADILWAAEPSPANGNPVFADAEPHPAPASNPASAEAESYPASGNPVSAEAESTPANGVPHSGDAQPGAADGEPVAEEPAVTPRPRSRRGASAARGRTRPATSR